MLKEVAIGVALEGEGTKELGSLFPDFLLVIACCEIFELRLLVVVG